jgi:hypothetical protein
VTACLAWLSTACSVTFMTPPPFDAAPGLPRSRVDCTRSYAWPIVDSALSTYQLASVAYLATLDDARFANYPISRKEDMALGAVFGAAYAGSAIYGYVAASRCRRVQDGPATPNYLPGVSSAGGPKHSSRADSLPERGGG